MKSVNKNRCASWLVFACVTRHFSQFELFSFQSPFYNTENLGGFLVPTLLLATKFLIIYPNCVTIERDITHCWNITQLRYHRRPLAYLLLFYVSLILASKEKHT